MSLKPVLTFVQVIWEPNYVRNYLDYTLPSELADDNLTWFKNKQVLYLILTREDDAAIIRSHPLYKRLCEIMNVQFFPIDSTLMKMSIPTTQKHCKFSAFQQIACLLALEVKSSVAFLSADAIWGNGSLRRIYEIYENDYKSIFLIGPRITREAMIAAIKQYRNQDGIVSLTNRQLADLTINTLHPQMKTSFWNTTTPNAYPSTFIWPLDKNALLFRCFHLHPILIDYSFVLKCKDYIVNRTIDSELAIYIYPDGKNMYIITDSDEVMVASHSPNEEDVLYDTVNSSYTNMDILKEKLADNNIRYCHQYFATKQIYIHSENLDLNKFVIIIDESNEAIWKIINH